MLLWREAGGGLVLKSPALAFCGFVARRLGRGGKDRQLRAWQSLVWSCHHEPCVVVVLGGKAEDDDDSSRRKGPLVRRLPYKPPLYHSTSRSFLTIQKAMYCTSSES